MASTFTDLGLELMETGENAGTWGTKTNANLSLIEQLTGGVNSQAVTDSGTPTALTIADGALTGTAQQRVIELTGTISGNRVVTFPLLTENFYIIKNGTSGSHTVQLKAASGSGATVTFAADDKGYKLIYLDGVATNTGLFEAALGSDGDVTLTGTQTLTNKTLTSPKIGTSILDTNGNELFKLTATSSAVNELTLANAATGNKPTLTASGSDTNISVAIQPKGSGTITLDNLTFPAADGSANQILTTNGSGVLSFVDNSGGTSWVAAVKTSNFTAAAGEGYFINTAGGAFEVDLPGSPSVGDEIEFVDFSRSFGTNALTLDQGSLKFQGFASPKPVYDTIGQSINIVYSGTTQGWIPTSDDAVSDETPQSYEAEYLVVAGGGSGGTGDGAGAGAGGSQTNFGGTAIGLFPGTTYTVTVGAGASGVAGSPKTRGLSGSNSVLSGSDITDITSIGGGGGGTSSNNPDRNGLDGGSGGGGGNGGGSGGDGTSGQGNDGGDNAGGGGGAGAAGGGSPGPGGNGLANSITGSSVTKAGGGGSVGAPGGTGGGTAGVTNPGASSSAPANTGGGSGGSNDNPGGAGGSGVVILRVADADYSGTVSGSPTVATGVSGDTVITFTGSGSYTA